MAQQPEKIAGEASFNNSPLTHWSFGALSSFMVDAKASKPRVKVGNDGKLTSDPLPRPMTLFVVNFAPTGYDADAPGMSLAERVRAFTGVIATPDFGLGGGISIDIWKGVGMNLGVGWVWMPSLRDTETLSGVPSKPNDPFEPAIARVAFIGASYNFGK